MITPSLNPESDGQRLDRLEEEYRHLLKRLERLEKQRGGTWAGLVGSIILLVLLGLQLNSLGVLPSVLQKLPVQAQSIEADEVILRRPEGKPGAKLHLSKDQLTVTRL